ncbi:MAG: hypothetical protein WEB02_05770 [Methylophaga sp.]
MCKQIEPCYEKKQLEELRPPEINNLLKDAETTGQIEIELETDLESGNDE